MANGGTRGAFLRLLAERAAVDSAYLAWVVRTYAEAEGRTTADVLVQMGVAENSAPDFLVSLRPNGERFVDMLKAICIRFGANEPAVLAVLREVEVLDAFRTGRSSSAGATDAGLLMAARMREEDSRPRRSRKDSGVRRDDERVGDGGDDAR